MKDKTQLLLGKILGEMYRIEKRLDGVACPVSDAQIFGLLNGFQNCIEEELEMIGYVSNEQYEAVINVLDEIDLDPIKLDAFTGFYNIEPKLKALGVDRSQANQIFRYLYADGRFVRVIDKMDSENSPIESRRFELDEFA